MTGIEGLAGRFQSDSLAGAYNQYTHGVPVISDSMNRPPNNLGIDVVVDYGDRWALFYRQSAVDTWFGTR